jgi:hypothetical protein
MEFRIKGPFKDNIYNLLRGLGYHFVSGQNKKYNFIKPMGGSAFPRFDIYIKTENDNLIINLHLDQKAPIYRGTTAHSGEYEGELVEKEAKRIKNSLL